MADLYAKDGIRCNAVAGADGDGHPCWGEGGLADQQAWTGKTRDEVLASVGAGRPLGRLAEPDEIARGDRLLLGPCELRDGAAWSADGGTVPIIV